MKICIIVGTYRTTSLRQIDCLRQRGYEVRKPPSESSTDVVVYAFKLDRDKCYLTSEFITSLERYDAVILSGGETASTILNLTRFHYLENVKGPSPLVSAATIKGGALDGKIVLLKGGLIGGDDIYLNLISWLEHKYAAGSNSGRS